MPYNCCACGWRWCCATAAAHQDMQGLQLQRQGPQQLLLQTPAGWAQRFPLSAQLLREEAEAISKTDWQLALQMD